MLLQQGLMAAAALAAGVCGAAPISRLERPWGQAVRMAAVGALAGLSLARGGPPLLSLALALAAVGSGWAQGPWPVRRAIGLGALLTAQLVYVALFLPAGGGRSALIVEPARDAPIAAVVALWCVMLTWLRPMLNRRLPLAFAFALTCVAMVDAAFTLPIYFALAMSGALCLMAAQLLGAAELVRGLDRRPVRLIWWLQFAAHAQIAYACLR